MAARSFWEENPRGPWRGRPVGDAALDPTALGFPLVLAVLQGHVFACAPPRYARTWTARFLRAIPVGADLSTVADRLVCWLLDPAGYNARQYLDPIAYQACDAAAALYRQWVAGVAIPESAWDRARAVVCIAAFDLSHASPGAWIGVRLLRDAVADPPDLVGAVRAAVDARAWAVDTRRAYRTAWVAVGTQMLLLVADAPVP